MTEPRRRPVVVDVSALRDPDAEDLDRLARMQLAARRAGRRLRLDNASPQLRELLALAGLGEALGCPESGLQEGRGVEEREQVGTAEEVRDPGDLPG